MKGRATAAEHRATTALTHARVRFGNHSFSLTRRIYARVELCPGLTQVVR